MVSALVCHTLCCLRNMNACVWRNLFEAVRRLWLHKQCIQTCILAMLRYIIM
jgi:hypothetical protein